MIVISGAPSTQSADWSSYFSNQNSRSHGYAHPGMLSATKIYAGYSYYFMHTMLCCKNKNRTEHDTLWDNANHITLVRNLSRSWIRCCARVQSKLI